MANKNMNKNQLFNILAIIEAGFNINFHNLECPE